MPLLYTMQAVLWVKPKFFTSVANEIAYRVGKL